MYLRSVQPEQVQSTKFEVARLLASAGMCRVSYPAYLFHTKNDKNEIKRSYAIWPYGHPGCDHPGGVVPFFIGKKNLECESPPHLGVQTVPLTLDFEI